MSKVALLTEQLTGCHRPPYRLCQSVVLLPIADGTARLFDLQGQFFALSEVAAQMLRDTLELGPDGAAESVARRWAVDVDVVKTDLEKFWPTCCGRGCWCRPTSPPVRLGCENGWWAWLCLPWSA